MRRNQSTGDLVFYLMTLPSESPYETRTPILLRERIQRIITERAAQRYSLDPTSSIELELGDNNNNNNNNNSNVVISHPPSPTSYSPLDNLEGGGGFRILRDILPLDLETVERERVGFSTPPGTPRGERIRGEIMEEEDWPLILVTGEF